MASYNDTMGNTDKKLDRYSLILKVQEIYNEVGRPITRNEFLKLSSVSQHQIYQLFPKGGWSEILELAELQPHSKTPINKISDEEFFVEYHRVVSKLGKIPTHHLFVSEATKGASVYRKRFSGKNQLLEKYKDWLLKNYPDSLNFALLDKEQAGKKRKTTKPERLRVSGGLFVDEQRLEELRLIHNDKFDLTKLIRLCEELNLSYVSGHYFSVASLTRIIIDHVPPIFGFGTFAEVANHYNGGKSLRESIQHLQNSSRKITDRHLHSPIRRKETLPNKTQVNFANDLDVLLEEVVRILK